MYPLKMHITSLACFSDPNKPRVRPNAKALLHAATSSSNPLFLFVFLVFVVLLIVVVFIVVVVVVLSIRHLLP
jgi:hypothetical protein